MKSFIGLLCLSLFATQGFARQLTPFIVNGSNADISNYPSFASLFFRSSTFYSVKPFCGATMLNAQYVLTAAHCVYDDENLQLHTVIAPQLEDKSNFLSNQQARALEFYFPDNYVNSAAQLWPNDIAIIKLETPLAVADYRHLLNTSINNGFTSGDFKAVGHGLAANNQNSGDRLQQTDLTYVSNAACRAEYGNNITSSHLCFSGAINGGFRASTCRGDSGGPVYWYDGTKYVQIGITSFGPQTCGDIRTNVTSVFTDVHDYQDWIARVLNGQEKPKAYVATVNGVRSIVKNQAPTTVQVRETPASDSGGGSSNGVFLFYLLLFGLVRHRHYLSTRLG